MTRSFDEKIRYLEEKYIRLGHKANARQLISKELVFFLRRLQGISRTRLELQYSMAAWQKLFKQGVIILHQERNVQEALALRDVLLEVLVDTDVIVTREKLQKYSRRIHFVFCPQHFETLPELYIAVQTEKDISKYSHSERAARSLKQALVVLDVSTTNIQYLYQKGFSYKQIFFCSLKREHLKYYLMRMLLSFELISTEKMFAVLNELDIVKLKNKEFVALSLVETIERRKTFLERYSNIKIFDGLRHFESWAGCALSYQYLSTLGLRNNIDYLAICEDDVVIDKNFFDRYSIVREFLFEYKHPKEWDVFVGVLADIPEELIVLDVEEFKGIKFVTINSMVSTVFNIYNKKAMQVLSRWDISDKNYKTNTIDRYFGSFGHNLRIVIALPFLVGHDGDSTLWDKDAVQMYDDNIKKSQKLIEDKVRAFESNSGQ